MVLEDISLKLVLPVLERLSAVKSAASLVRSLWTMKAENAIATYRATIAKLDLDHEHDERGRYSVEAVEAFDAELAAREAMKAKLGPELVAALKALEDAVYEAGEGAPIADRSALPRLDDDWWNA
jgi:hypothetical protein